MRTLKNRIPTVRYASLILLSLSVMISASVSGSSLPAFAGNKKPIDWEHDKNVAKARQLRATNNVEEAQKLIDDQLKKHPEAAVLHCELGKCYKARFKQAEARSELKRATELDNNCAEAWYELGAIYEKDNDFQMAVDAYEKYLALAPFADRKDSVKDRLNFCKSKL